MEIYVTSSNDGPSWSNNVVRLKYIGPDQDEAQAVLSDFVKYRNYDYLLGGMYPEVYTIVPHDTPFEYVAFYEADGWWASIVRLNFED